MTDYFFLITFFISINVSKYPSQLQCVSLDVSYGCIRIYAFSTLHPLFLDHEQCIPHSFVHIRHQQLLVHFILHPVIFHPKIFYQICLLLYISIMLILQTGCILEMVVIISYNTNNERMNNC